MAFGRAASASPSEAGRRRATDLREVFNAIHLMLATGCQWRAIPKCFPPFTRVQNYFYAWRGSGVYERMMDALRGLARDRRSDRRSRSRRPLRRWLQGSPSSTYFLCSPYASLRKENITMSQDSSISAGPGREAISFTDSNAAGGLLVVVACCGIGAPHTSDLLSQWQRPVPAGI